MKIETRQFFQKYLDPHKPEVAEWGAQVGFWGGDRAAALGRVVKLAGTAISQAGLSSSKRLEYRKQALTEIETLRSSIRSRVLAAFARLTGVRDFSSPKWSRRILEGALDIAAVALLPLFLFALWPPAVVARWGFHRAEERESSIVCLKEAAKTYLALWFEVNAERGELAAKISGRGSEAAGGRSGATGAGIS